MRALKIAGAVIGAVVVVIAVLLMIGIPSGFLTAQIQERVERETGYKLAINGGARIGLWPSLNITLNDVTVQHPKDRDINRHFAAASIEAEVTLASLWAGKPHITELVIIRPVANLPLRRERDREPNAPSKPAAGKSSEAFTIEHISVSGGTVILSNVRDRVENRIETVNADITIDSDRKIVLTGSARRSGYPLKFEIKAAPPAAPIERQNIPAEIRIDAPDLLSAPLTAKAEARLNGSVVMINGVTGALGDAAFNGWASVDLSSKPLVKLDLDFQKLAVAMARSTGSTAGQPWSSATIDVNGLNYIDLQVRMSAAELKIGDARFIPAAIDATLATGVLKAQVSNLGAYEGTATGDLTVDVSTANPTYAMRADLTGVRALPLLDGLADFDKIDGRMQAKVSVRSSGNSQRAIMSNMAGTAFIVFQDGAIKGLNVAQMIRSLTASTLVGLAGERGEGDRPFAIVGVVQDRQGPGADHRSQSGRPAGQDDRRGHHRSRHQADRVPRRAEARDDHRRPGPRQRSGRARHPRDDLRPVGKPTDLSGDAGHPRQSRRRLCQAEGDGQGPVRREGCGHRGCDRQSARRAVGGGRRTAGRRRRTGRNPAAVRSAASSARPSAICCRRA